MLNGARYYAECGIPEYILGTELNGDVVVVVIVLLEQTSRQGSFR